MRGFWRQLEYEQIKQHLRQLKPYKQISFGNIKVQYKGHLDGGGSTFGQAFHPFLRERGMPKQQRLFEWCAGPGFIGFSMLAQGFCETLCLADVNPKAVAACRRTVKQNGLSDRVSVYLSDNLADIPASEKWDLVVSNPPHFIDEFVDEFHRGDLRAHDPEWRIHRTFFSQVGRFLKPGGVIVLQENNQGSTAETFRKMIEDAGLQIVFVHGDRPERTRDPLFYFIGIVRAGDRPPAWAHR